AMVRSIAAGGRPSGAGAAGVVAGAPRMMPLAGAGPGRGSLGGLGGVMPPGGGAIAPARPPGAGPHPPTDPAPPPPPPRRGPPPPPSPHPSSSCDVAQGYGVVVVSPCRGLRSLTRRPR